MSQRSGEAEETNISSGQEDAVSLAHSLPMEMVETILLDLTVPQFLVAALHLPKWWQDVIECSGAVWRRIARYRYDEHINVLVSNKSPLSTKSKDKKRKVARTISCLLKSGMLFIHRSSLGRGDIFAPGSEDLSTKILDPDICMIRYYKDRKAGIGRWTFRLYDLEGECMCRDVFRDDNKSAFGESLQAVIEDRKPELDDEQNEQCGRSEYAEKCDGYPAGATGTKQRGRLEINQGVRRWRYSLLVEIR